MEDPRPYEMSGTRVTVLPTNGGRSAPHNHLLRHPLTYQREVTSTCWTLTYGHTVFSPYCSTNATCQPPYLWRQGQWNHVHVYIFGENWWMSDSIILYYWIVFHNSHAKVIKKMFERYYKISRFHWILVIFFRCWNTQKIFMEYSFVLIPVWLLLV